MRIGGWDVFRNVCSLDFCVTVPSLETTGDGSTWLKSVNLEKGRQKIPEAVNPTVEQCRGDSKEDSKGMSQEDSWTEGFESNKPGRSDQMENGGHQMEAGCDQKKK